jgi:hypothetical protein
MIKPQVDIFGNETYPEVRALWWRQPYGSLMLHGKRETRTWDTPYRGLVLICTSKYPYTIGDVGEISGDFYRKRIAEVLKDEPTRELHGYAIAVGRLYDARTMGIREQKHTYVEYKPGLFCHCYANVRRIEPFKLSGSQGWRVLDKDVIQKIQILETA